MFETMNVVKSPILDGNLLNYRDWKVGEAFPPAFPLNPIGPAFSAESHHNQMLMLPGPINGKLTPIVSSLVTDTLKQVHGGLVSTIKLIDINKSYRLSVWVNVSSLQNRD